jgi:hypothetical protein
MSTQKKIAALVRFDSNQREGISLDAVRRAEEGGPEPNLLPRQCRSDN